jgi:hypothetical protein
LIAGFLLGVVADLVRQWLNRKTRREERSEAAAKDLIGVIDRACDPFRDAYRLDADVDHAQVRERVGELRQKALLLDDDAALQRMELLARILEYHHVVKEWTGDSFSSIAYAVWTDGRACLRATLAGRTLPPRSDKVEAYGFSIAEHLVRWEKEHMEEDARRRRSQSD